MLVAHSHACYTLVSYWRTRFIIDHSGTLCIQFRVSPLISGIRIFHEQAWVGAGSRGKCRISDVQMGDLSKRLHQSYGQLSFQMGEPHFQQDQDSSGRGLWGMT